MRKPDLDDVFKEVSNRFAEGGNWAYDDCAGTPPKEPCAANARPIKFKGSYIPTAMPQVKKQLAHGLAFV